MAEITNISTEKKLVLNDQVASRDISRKFGRPEDYIELHIYNTNNQLLFSEQNFTQYSFPPGSTDLQSLTSEINMDPVEVLRSYGYTSGKYKLIFNIQRKKIFTSTEPPFTITEISPTKREIRGVANNVNNETFDTSLKSFISEIEGSLYFKDFVLNLGKNINPLGINILLNTNPSKHEILIKLLEPLPSTISTRDLFSIAEEISDPLSLTIDLGEPELEDNSTPLQGPNFKIDTRLNNSVPSSYKNYDEVLNYSFTSSYQNLLNQLENREIPEIVYDYIRPVSEENEDIDQPYHFENFVHFGSALERVKNFAYKIELIELYDSEINQLNLIPTSSTFTLTNKEDVNTKKQNLIKGFDGYEQFLYYNSGSNFSWPKSTITLPYTLYHNTSSQVKAWLGDERFSFPNYGGQLLSASLFDNQNEYALINLVPKHIVDNPDNDFYQTFVHMIGHHYDTIWTYIKAMTDVQDAHNKTGISKDLVYLQLKSLGIEAFDQFENSNLIEYILGQGINSNALGDFVVGDYTVGGNSNAFYNAEDGIKTFVTASNIGSIPKQDITKEIWKRLYHNAPYLLKTKGTERGLKALMSCYGVPSTILNVKEYGGSTVAPAGPIKDIDLADFYKTFTYEKSGLALKGNTTSDSSPFITTNWSSSLTDALSASNKTIELRIKPNRTEGNNYNVLSLKGSGSAGHILLSIENYTGNDISSSNDSTQYGRLNFSTGSSGDTLSSTNYFPLYNGSFWNIFLSSEGISGSTSNIEFGAYQANFNRNISSYTSTYTQPESHRAITFGDPYYEAGSYIGGASEVLIAGEQDILDIGFSGSIQELRYYFGEILSDATLKKHALEPFMYAGNTISSSFDNIVLRLPLGSNDQQDTSSFHPNIDVDYLGAIVNTSASQYEEVVENHYHPTPDTVGISMTSEKVRIDTGTVDDDILSINVRSEESTLDRQPQDFEDLGVFFSPTTEINEDIVYQLGAFRLDDYIGSPLPSAQSSSNYGDLKTIKDIYFKRVNKRYNYWDYIKTIQYFDHTLFKLVEQFVPMKANLKTGLLIEPHYLERNKFARELPVIDYGTTMTEGSYQTLDFQIDPERAFTLSGSSVITTNNLSSTTSSITGKRLETGTNVTIDIDDYVLDEQQNIAQAPIKPLLSEGTRTVIFEETFSSDISTLEGITSYFDGSETLTSANSTFPTDQGHVSGSKVLKIGDDSGNDASGLIFDAKIPLNPEKLYEFEVRIKGEADNEGFVYAGAQGFDAGGNSVNAVGNSVTTVQFNVLRTNNPLTSTSFTVFKGYMLGQGADGVNVSSGRFPDILNPGKFHSNVTQFSPYFLMNYNGEAGIMYIDYFTIREVGRGQFSGYIARKSSTLLGNAVKGRLSSIYYRKLTNGKETEY